MSEREGEKVRIDCGTGTIHDRAAVSDGPGGNGGRGASGAAGSITGVCTGEAAGGGAVTGSETGGGTGGGVGEGAGAGAGGGIDRVATLALSAVTLGEVGGNTKDGAASAGARFSRAVGAAFGLGWGRGMRVCDGQRSFSFNSSAMCCKARAGSLHIIITEAEMRQTSHQTGVAAAAGLTTCTGNRTI